MREVKVPATSVVSGGRSARAGGREADTAVTSKRFSLDAQLAENLGSRDPRRRRLRSGRGAGDGEKPGVFGRRVIAIVGGLRSLAAMVVVVAAGVFVVVAAEVEVQVEEAGADLAVVVPVASGVHPEPESADSQ